jgi:TonB family protein
MNCALARLAGLSTLFIAAESFQPALAADAIACPAPEPIIKTFTLTPYPSASQRAGESGVTMLMVTVPPDGTPSGATVTHSSGAQRLDDAASSYILSHYRWEKSAEGCPASQRPITVIWQLGDPPKADGAVLVPLASYPADALQLKAEGDTYLALSLGDGGAVNNVRIAYTSGYTELDNQSVALVKASPNLVTGKPAGRYIFLFRWKLPAELSPSDVITTSHAQRMR